MSVAADCVIYSPLDPFTNVRLVQFDLLNCSFIELIIKVKTTERAVRNCRPFQHISEHKMCSQQPLARSDRRVNAAE